MCVQVRSSVLGYARVAGSSGTVGIGSLARVGLGSLGTVLYVWSVPDPGIILVDQTVCFLIGLVMFFNLTNLDTKLVVAILGQDLAL